MSDTTIKIILLVALVVAAAIWYAIPYLRVRSANKTGKITVGNGFDFFGDGE